ncbi:MAG: universal stress protein [Thermoflexibacter sp.]|jgi:nucleotide-binding universal stress UspA family protein|nr:universal stress protein [Thermoflexibacter sp.]
MGKILVPIDFSDYSKNALDYAVVIAKTLKSSITVFHSFYFSTPPEYGTLANYMAMAIEDEQKRFEEQMKELLKVYENQEYDDKSGTLQINSIVKLGLPKEDITDIVREQKYDLIVMGTRGATGLDRLLFGSITASIVEDEDIKCTLLAVPKDAKNRGIKHVLYGMDYEEDDVPVIDELLEFAGYFEAKVTCLHVNTDEDMIPSDKLEKEILQDTYWFTPYNKIKFELVKSESIKSGVDGYIKDHHVDLVAVMPRKRSFLESLFHKSVSKSLATHSGVPVLVIKK